MNICIIVDTSLSMNQVFSKQLSFLDSVKFAVERLVALREKNKKIDKFFLINTNYNDNILSDWEDSLSHFLFKVKTIQSS